MTDVYAGELVELVLPHISHMAIFSSSSTATFLQRSWRRFSFSED